MRGVASSCVTGEVRADLNGSNASLRRMLRASLVEVLLTMDQRRGPKPARPDEVRHLDDCGAACALNCVDRTMSTHVTVRSFARVTKCCHFCDSNLQPSTIAFCHCCAEEHCVISPC